MSISIIIGTGIGDIEQLNENNESLQVEVQMRKILN